MIKDICDTFLTGVAILCMVIGCLCFLIGSWMIHPILFALVVLFCLALLGSAFG